MLLLDMAGLRRLILALSVCLLSSISAEKNDGMKCVCVFSPKDSPVCGSDGKTYPNVELLNHEVKCNNKPIVWDHDGACNNSVVHETDGKNLEKDIVKTLEKLIASGKVEMVYDDEDDLGSLPNSKRPCKSCSDLLVVDPVCGTNGITYNNAHVLRYINRRDGCSIDVAYPGMCRPNHHRRCPPVPHWRRT